MSVAAPEVLAQPNQHEAMAHVEHQAEAAQQQPEHLHTHLDVAHGMEGHVCTPNCEHSQAQANEVSDDLFAEIEKEHVCGPNCEHHQTKANEISDSLFDDLKRPDAEAVKPKVEPTKTKVDTETASKTAEELDHDHEHHHHVCDANCEHNQPQANKHAGSLFDELDRKPPEAQKTPSEAIKEQINTATKNEAQQQAAAASVAEQATQVRNPEADAAFRQYIEANGAGDVVDTTNEDNVVKTDTRLQAAKPQEQAAIDTSREAISSLVVAPKTETVRDNAVEDGAIDILNATETKVEAAEVIDIVEPSLVIEDLETLMVEQDEADTLEGNEPFLADVALTDEAMSDELTEAGESLSFESVELPVPLVENDEIDLSEIMTDIHAVDTTQDEAGISLHDEAVAPIEVNPDEKLGSIPQRVELEAAPDVSEVIADIIELLEPLTAVESTEAVTVKVSGIKEKLEELATKLSIEYSELLEMLQLTENEEIVFDQQAYDILRGLRKDLSIEYSFEFSQFSSSQSTDNTITLTQALGQFILLFLTRRQSEQQLLAA